MPVNTTLTTARLRLRHWRDEDLPVFAAMNADPRVMERLGMKRSEEDDFLHPLLEGSHPLRAHVLYRITRPDP